MATVSTPPRRRSLAEANAKVLSPLARLRKYIRTYVSLEGAAVLGLYLALWFWIGLLLDYGFFKLFTWDWVQILPWGFRAGVLVVLVAGLLAAVATKVVTRLFKEFRDAALALVLERRFPQLLGDRLITAVELSDPEKAATFGYSAAMVRQTIHDAAERVDQLPLKEVFDWRRLIRRGVLLALLTVGAYLMAGAGFCAVDYARTRQAGLGGFTDFHEVAGIWFERNILLEDTIWPRKAHLELVGFPASGEIRIGQGSTPPPLRVRALKYVIAGAPTAQSVDAYRSWLQTKGESGDGLEEKVAAFKRKPAEGWRAVTWFDLTPKLLGADVPHVSLPADWDARSREAGLTLDEIELKLAKPETHETLDADTKDGLRKALELLHERAQQAGMSRTLRELIVPDLVTLSYSGRSSSSQSTLQKIADNEYTGGFGELKESVSFTVQGEDYYTARRHVTVVDPPALERLLSRESQPAYLFYRPAPGSKPEELRGRKQPFNEAEISVQGGETSRVDVPAGTDLVLTGTATKELVRVRLLQHKTLEELAEPKPEVLDARTFRVSFPDVRAEQRFVFEFTDTDNVVGVRQVVIMPAPDSGPKIKELAPDDIIRRVKEGLMVSVNARVPFKGLVEDDHGLSDVRYAYTVTRLETVSRLNVRSVYMSGAVPMIAAGGLQRLGLLPFLAASRFEANKPVEPAAGGPKTQYADLPLFGQRLREHVALAALKPENARPEVIPMQTVRELLAQNQNRPYRALLRSFPIKPDVWLRAEDDPLECDFPLWKAGLKVNDPRMTQPRYKVELWLEATDTDLDSDRNADGSPRPHLSPSGEKFTFIVVSEPELLTEIAKEEEKKYEELDAAFQKLVEAEARLGRTYLDLSDNRVKVDNLGPMSARVENLANEVLDKCQRDTHGVYVSYERVLRELKTNQVDPRIIERVDKTIVTPLREIDSGEYDRTRDALVDFRKALDNQELAGQARIDAARAAGTKAKAQVQQLKNRLNAVLGAMTGLIDINKLIKALRDIEAQEQAQADIIQAMKRDLEDKLIEGAIEGTQPKKKPNGK